MLKELHCGSCGDALKAEGDTYVCPSCGRKYKEDSLAEHIRTISEIFGDMLAYQKEEQIANIRRNLWQAIHEQYIDSIKIVGYCRELKKLLPDDFQANIYEVLNSDNVKQINKSLDDIDTAKYLNYIPDIINFMLNSLVPENLLAVNNLIERAYKETDLTTYDEFATKFAEEAKKVDECVYDIFMPRDVFVAYSSADMAKVSELVSVLEDEGLSCFVAMRNLQHGRGAVGNYEKQLQEAIDNCKTVVLVSSVMSRTRSDARKVELPYIRKRDIERAPAEYGNDYAKMPAKYKKPRVEYLVEGYKGMAAESFVKEFFAGNEYRYSPKEVAEAVFNIMSMPVEEEKKSEAPIASDDLRRLMKKMDQLENAQQATSNTGSTNVNSLLIRAKQFFENNDMANAKTYYSRVLDEQPENAEAWWGLSLITTRFNEKSTQENFDITKYEALINDADYKRAAMYADGDLKRKFDNYKLFYNNSIERRNTQFEISNGNLIKYKGGDEKIVVVPDDVTSIGDWAFAYCSNIMSVIIGDGVKSIGIGAFRYCTNLIKVTIGKNVKNIGDDAFYMCNKLIEVCNKSSLCIQAYNKGHSRYGADSKGHNVYGWIGYRAKNVYTPAAGISKLKKYGSYIFYVDNTKNEYYLLSYKGNDVNLTLPNNCENKNYLIVRAAFCENQNLQNLTIGNGVLGIGDWAFTKCKNLKKVKYEGDIASWCKIEFSNDDSNPLCNEAQLYIQGKLVEELKISEGITEIKAHTFCGCSSLTNVTIGNNVTSIGDGAFSRCHLKNVTIPKRFVGFMKSGLKRIFGADAIKKINFTFTN